MIEATSVMLVITIMLSVWAFVAWLRVSQARAVRMTNGRKAIEPGDAAIAKQLLLVIVFVDAVAACFGLMAWLSA